DTGKFVVISSPLIVIPEELKRTMALVELLTPDLPEIVDFLNAEIGALARTGVTADTSEGTIFELARAVQGLTLDEARYALRRAMAHGVNLDSSAVPQLMEEKRLLVKKTGMIEFITDTTHLDHVGGLEYLKR